MIGVIIFTIFIIITCTSYAYNTGKHKTEMNHLNGFWETNKTFNDESGLSIFTMYIGKCSNGVYPVYILMVDTDENILINTPSNMSLSRTSLLNFKSPFTSEPSSVFKEFNATFTDLESEFMPNMVTLKYFPQSCKVVLVGNDTIYGCLFKNLELTEMASIKDENKIQSNSTNNYDTPPQDTQDNSDVFQDVA